MREDEEPKKRGWFSRKKKPTNASPRVSRPPSTASFPSHHRKTSSQSTLTDDLPPREGSPVSSQVTLSTPESPSRTPTVDSPLSRPDTPEGSNLPKTAGFNLAAIKEAIGKADLNPEELQMPAPTPLHVPSVPPLTQRSESAPPPIPEPLPPSPSLPRSLIQSHDLPHLPSASSSRTDLSATLSRSMSLNDMKVGDDDLTSSNEKTPSAAHAFRPPPPLTFGSGDGSFWPAEPDRPTPFDANPFSSFGRDPFNTPRPTPFGEFGSTSRPQESLYPPPESAGLSFGGSDGSITFVPSPAVRTEPPDPWNISSPSFGGYSSKKTSNSLNVANPWQS